MRSNDKRSTGGRKVLRLATLNAAVVAALAGSGVVYGFEIPTGNEDLVLRWDNTVRYNIGKRVQSEDSSILKNVNFDDGDRNFSKGSVVTNRFDVLSEADIVWKRQFGARVSAAGWYDFAYSNLDNTNTATANPLSNGLPVAGQLSPYTKRYGKGVSGEWLDAFVFANFDAGEVPISIKAGQHTVFWGDSLLLGGAIHGISYAQNSIDAWKGFATPGAEAKELFRPKGGITVQAQVSKDLSLAGQWFYDWQAIRVPESGSYLTVSDAFLFGGDSLITGANPLAAAFPGSPAMWRAWNARAVSDRRNASRFGDFGVSARWKPDWLDGTMGFYYRNATDIQPQLLLTPGVAALPSATCLAIGGIVVAPLCITNPNATSVADLTQKGKMGTYQAAYGNNIHFYGLSLAKDIAGISVGAELSYRQNMPLVSDAVLVLPAAFVPSTPGSVATTAVPSNGDTVGAVGNTYHAVLNGLGVLGRTALWDSATWAAELTWMRWDKVTQNMAVFKGRPGYSQIDRVSKNYWGIAFNFTPTWFQVFPGVDLLAPMSYQIGLSGNSAVSFGGNEDAGLFGVGVAADIYQKYRIDLKYTGYMGNYTTNPATGAVSVFNGTTAALSDRGWVSLTFKTTF